MDSLSSIQWMTPQDVRTSGLQHVFNYFYIVLKLDKYKSMKTNNRELVELKFHIVYALFIVSIYWLQKLSFLNVLFPLLGFLRNNIFSTEMFWCNISGNSARSLKCLPIQSTWSKDRSGIKTRNHLRLYKTHFAVEPHSNIKPINGFILRRKVQYISEIHTIAYYILWLDHLLEEQCAYCLVTFT